MLGEHYEFVGLMVSLLLRGLLDTGEYLVVGVDPRQYDPKRPTLYLEGNEQRTLELLHKDDSIIQGDHAYAINYPSAFWRS